MALSFVEIYYELDKQKNCSITKNVTRRCTDFQRFIHKCINDTMVFKLFFCAIFQFCKLVTLHLKGGSVSVFFGSWTCCNDFYIINGFLADFIPVCSNLFCKNTEPINASASLLYYQGYSLNLRGKMIDNKHVDSITW